MFGLYIIAFFLLKNTPKVLNVIVLHYGNLIQLADFSQFLKGRQLLPLPVCFAAHQVLFERGLLQNERICSQGEQILSF